MASGPVRPAALPAPGSVRTFAGWLKETGWVKRFTQAARPGAYLRVIQAGEIRAGDPVDIVHRPEHDVSIEVVFRAMTLERELLPRILAADALHPLDVSHVFHKRGDFAVRLADHVQPSSRLMEQPAHGLHRGKVQQTATKEFVLELDQEEIDRGAGARAR